ncbi:spore germination protein [Fervidibacillus halotolerans]|uniref:Spore germination protein n=1 Tax=Fervidibacillus halotolerans TaxID=2980027 RepID=A0A9E8LY98_9BACI|nr:spore germination protein [Fervidibacillus halotolerans]WAA11937.1 spore germination protein [Fervidibacillus halotolerans]
MKRKKQSVQSIKTVFTKSQDYKRICYENKITKLTFTLTFLTTVTDEKIVRDHILPFLLENEWTKLEDVKSILPIEDLQLTDDTSQIEKKLLNGFVMLTLEKEQQYCFISAKKENIRNITVPEVEFSVIGPKEAFVESLSENLNLIRKRLQVKELIVEQLEVGTLSKTNIVLLYLDGITNEANINTMRQRIKDLEVDHIADSSYIVQMISDNQNSPFPQFLDTERPDRVAATLSEGKVVLLVDGSPHAIIGPVTIVEFFSAFEDYFLNWILASFFRLIRFFAVAFSVLVTPIYVATLTYHYELIPQDLIGILVTSRRAVPFPPIIEALFLELTIELLREAGARLPTKVGQTIGIVGGIVIGTASVEAGLTSNVLLIFVALAALASFTTPVYRIGNTIRLLRFPFLLVGDIWGLIGISLCFSFLLTHMIRLTSLGRPYLEPIYPPRLQDFKDAFIRLPFYKQSKRPNQLRTKKASRFDRKNVIKKVKKDIDE